ncbi:hypothetical protein BT67DRAFT_462150 [Trichocladium antarcticum]|uniref:cyclin-dependent kinase n=1 Tax=Trichocladium antarcticum TaxID=1450529 RepID=A0AAN6UKC5_9PEZI|nr:hypothetical protein BT67DRAFT_462150 [Trichocladium antarcticum]
MADTDWRSSLTASERYDNIQNLTTAVAAGQSAFSIEKEAYNSARNRDEYEAACNPSRAAAQDAEPCAFPAAVDVPPDNDSDRDSDPGITIGPYKNCHYVASGVTAEVHRSETRALKVIVETHNIEPHDPHREAKILAALGAANAPNIIRLIETFRDQSQRFVLVFPYQPLTLAHVLDRAASPLPDPLTLDVGTGPYRAPETLFGNAAYTCAADQWAAGAMLAECVARPRPRALFASRAAHEDGNQLGLILSIFQTVGSPTPATWPEAAGWKIRPWEMYREFEGRTVVRDEPTSIRGIAGLAAAP